MSVAQIKIFFVDGIIAFQSSAAAHQHIHKDTIHKNDKLVDLEVVIKNVLDLCQNLQPAIFN